MIPSIASGSATPSWRVRIASLIIGMSILLLTKPGESWQDSGIFPISSDAETTSEVTSSDVSLPLIISTSFIIGTGFMKCIPITLSALFVCLAISFMEMLDVLLARIAWGLHIESSLLKVENFKSGISGIASTTRSQSERDSRSTDEEILENAESASSRLIRSFETSLSREFDIAEVPLSRNSCLMSTIVTSIPQQAATCAIPLPICPEPTTPTDRIAMCYSSSGGDMRFG